MATGATEHIDKTTADAFVPEIWSKRCIVAREEALIFYPTINNEFNDEASYGDTVHVTSIGNLSVQSKNTASNAATLYETITESNTDISIATWEYSAIAIETFAKTQVPMDLLEKYAPKQGYALGESLDATLAGLIDDFTQTLGTLAQPLTYPNILRARQYLNDANAPQTNRTIVISPAQEASFMELDHFINNDYSKIQGGVQTDKEAAYIGKWLQLPVLMSTNVEGTNAAGHDCGMYQQEVIACVLQMEPTSHEFFDIDYFAHKISVEQIYGVKEMRDDHGVWMKGL